MLALAGLAALLLGIAWFVRGDLRGIREGIADAIRPSVTEPITLENIVVNPTCVTRSKVVDEVTHTLMWYQQEGESWKDFIKRVSSEWASYCADL